MKRLLLHITLLAAIVLSSASCASVSVEGPDEPKGEIRSRFDIEASVDDGLHRSRAKTVFTKNMAFGFVVYRHGTTDPFAMNTSNISTTCTGVDASGKLKWSYHYYNGKFTTDQLYLVQNPKDAANADFFAYYPVKSDTSVDLTNMTYSASTDIMYCAQNADPTVNEDIYVDGTPQTLNFHFERKMAHIMVGMRLMGGKGAGTGSVLWVKEIKMRKMNDNAPIYSSVKFNAIDGTLTLGENDVVDEFKYSFTESQGTVKAYYGDTDANGNDSYKWFTLVCPPVDVSGVADDDTPVYDLDFIVQYGAPMPLCLCTFHITKGMLLHDDGVTYGLNPGYNYKFYITMENYLHLDHVYVDDKWITETEEIAIPI